MYSPLRIKRRAIKRWQMVSGSSSEWLLFGREEEGEGKKDEKKKDVTKCSLGACPCTLQLCTTDNAMVARYFSGCCYDAASAGIVLGLLEQ